ncbi:hypothetical protein OG897_07720 [Streptomyces sp. NBC_00237]|uniref:hypothetical protein n=1 Tax=Streptomyces sp. NBC_00237 TaxID=2975687 RepID=UPI002250E0C3|nr:hypothetical protein [Streptomyces sp. NBC_00237]MCX5201342.1 hypothetical protein [Streptomyces sp. NBC_00237]
MDVITAADIGKRVEDAQGRIGILCDVIPDYADPGDPPGRRRKRPTAFLRPEGGGVEWTVSPDDVRLT